MRALRKKLELRARVKLALWIGIGKAIILCFIHAAAIEFCALLPLFP